MKHVVAGGLVTFLFLGVVLFWALLGELMGPEWALIVMLVAALIWVGTSIFDYWSERTD